METRTPFISALIAASVLGINNSINDPKLKVNDPWAPKTYGRQKFGGSSFDSKASSPTFRKTRHGSFKKR